MNGLQLPPWLLAKLMQDPRGQAAVEQMAQQPLQGPGALMGRPDFSGAQAMNPRAPLSSGLPQQGLPPQGMATGPQAMGTPRNMTQASMGKQFPTGMGTGAQGGMDWGALAGMAGGLLNQQSSAEPYVRPPAPGIGQGMPLGEMQMSLYDQVRRRGY